MYKTTSKSVSFDGHTVWAGKPSALPLSVGDPTTVAEGIGEVLGASASKVLGKIGFMTIPNINDRKYLARKIKGTIPSSVGEGDWPEDPCN